MVVRGNHDRASTGQDDLEWFNPVARNAAVWTLQALSPENADYILALPRGPVTVETFQVFHGSPYDEDEYVIAAGEADQAFSYLETRVAFFGHTHVQGGFIWNQSRVETILRTPARQRFASMPIDPECAYMINPGPPASRATAIRGRPMPSTIPMPRKSPTAAWSTTLPPRSRRFTTPGCRRFWPTACPWAVSARA